MPDNNPTLNQTVEPVPQTQQAANTSIGVPQQPTPAAPSMTVQSSAGPLSAIPNPGAMPKSNGTPSVWKNVLAGALWGLAGSAGAKTFGAGAAGGARGVLEEKPAFEANQAAQQQQLQMESARAADSHILAMKQAEQADLGSEKLKLELATYKANIDAFNQAMGIRPTLTLSADNSPDMHAQANGGLSTLAQRNGGTIPGVATVNSPASASNPNHTIDVYAKPTPQDIQDNSGNYRKLVNVASVINTGSPVTDDQWRTGGGAMKIGSPETEGMAMLQQQREGQAQMVLAAQQRLYSIPAVQANPSANAATSARLKQQLTSYAARPDADQSVVGLLQQQLKTFDAAAQDANAKAATAAADMERQKKMADFNTPQGRAEYQRTLQETINAKYQNLANHQKMLFEQGRDPETGETLNLANAPDEMLIDPQTHQPVPTSMVQSTRPTMQERNRADFANSTLHSLDEIDRLKASGRLPNGPLSGLTAKALASAGMSTADAMRALNFISFAQSAATGAHAGGRFNQQILEKMNHLISLNMNSSQFQGAEAAIRSVMTQYAEHGGIETVGQYKAGLIGSVKSYQGKAYRVVGLDKNGNAQLVPFGGR